MQNCGTNIEILLFFGVEPSKNAKKFFQKVMPHISIFEGIFQQSPYLNGNFELITANGVLEHVPHPVEFLKEIRNSISEDGHVFIGVPNFENNPWHHRQYRERYTSIEIVRY